MKKYVYIIVLIWALLAGGITAYNENLLRKGEEILLKVSPVDPRDFLRTKPCNCQEHNRYLSP